MHWKKMFVGDYIAAVEFDGKTPTMKIKSVDLVKLEDDDGRQKDKGVIFFEQTDRGWVLCKTNAICLAAMFGDDTNGWIGKRVTLHAVDVQVGRERMPGIRVKGSPDIKAPLDVEIRLPKKKPFTMRMAVTGQPSSPPPAQGAAA